MPARSRASTGGGASSSAAIQRADTIETKSDGYVTARRKTGQVTLNLGTFNPEMDQSMLESRKSDAAAGAIDHLRELVYGIADRIKFPRFQHALIRLKVECAEVQRHLARVTASGYIVVRLRLDGISTLNNGAGRGTAPEPLNSGAGRGTAAG